MTEKWAKVTIPDFSDNYEVSNFGRVRSRRGVLTNQKRSMLKSYKSVYLHNKEIKQTCSVHRLVALAFIPNPENKKTVNHKDGDGTNNHVDNLEWMTYSENSKHSFDVLGKTIWNKNLQYCRNGHERTEENIYVDPKGGKACRTCSNLRSKLYKRKVRAITRKRG